jgi:hypothetical protein
MLFVPKFARLQDYITNMPTNPGTSMGTVVTPGISDAEGSWTLLFSAGTVDAPLYGFDLWIYAGYLSGQAKNFLADIGIDPAGGSSYQPIISNIICGESGSLATSYHGHKLFFPIYIPQGASIACRIQGSHAIATTSRVLMMLYKRGAFPECFPQGFFCETIGSITNSNGVSFTPGNATDGSWVQLGTTTLPLWWWQHTFQCDNATAGAEYLYIDLAYGDASNKVIINRTIGVISASENLSTELGAYEWPRCYCPVPAGSNIYIRGRCNDAPNTGYNALAYGIGG